ncbi:general transcription factor II-I repeat domain-containing protein 1-like [Tachysurus fulvidraco]|uniref:general transcription factor II-I repeat domain-containing protein 1-like n=1 Tax=Tachysurus fulvidraco TaxID=1234273 RepID=UPI001FEEDFAF|nr:general transcription factor II-I repeat domain-containing protein 1-like [Tachysurus fulvidraco]XP_047659663.1 general transcription factor II-I repeat domain-containing protein 1-like [Tachysurus fulvidraco]
MYELSSKGAADFLDSTDTVNNFALQFKEEARGTVRLPYQSLVNQGMTIKVAGLPNSLTFKKPSYYGRNQLEAILQAAEEISFEISK